MVQKIVDKSLKMGKFLGSKVSWIQYGKKAANHSLRMGKFFGGKVSWIQYGTKTC